MPARTRGTVHLSARRQRGAPGSRSLCGSLTRLFFFLHFQGEGARISEVQLALRGGDGQRGCDGAASTPPIVGLATAHTPGESGARRRALSCTSPSGGSSRSPLALPQRRPGPAARLRRRAGACARPRSPERPGRWAGSSESADLALTFEPPCGSSDGAQCTRGRPGGLRWAWSPTKWPPPRARRNGLYGREHAARCSVLTRLCDGANRANRRAEMSKDAAPKPPAAWLAVKPYFNGGARLALGRQHHPVRLIGGEKEPRGQREEGRIRKRGGAARGVVLRRCTRQGVTRVSSEREQRLDTSAQPHNHLPQLRRTVGHGRHLHHPAHRHGQGPHPARRHRRPGELMRHAGAATQRAGKRAAPS